MRASKVLDRMLAGFATSRWTVPSLIALAIGVRLALILLLPQHPYSDGEWYLVRAREIAQGMGYQEAGVPTAFWPVGYPAMLAASMIPFGPGLFGPILLNLIAIAATIALILWFGRTLRIDALGSRAAALLYALYPAHIVYAGQAVTETVAVAMIMAAFALLIAGRGRWWMLLLAGFAFGACTLVRAQMLLFPAGAIVALWLVYRDMNWRKALVATLIVYAGMAAVVAPWTIRNQQQMHAFVLVSTNGGEALYTGANDQATGDWFAWEHTPLWDRSGYPFSQRVQYQVEIDRAFRRLSWDWIEANPLRWTALGFKKMGLLWLKDSDAFWSLDKSYPQARTGWTLLQAANQLYYLVLLGLGTVGLIAGLRGLIRRDWATAPLALLGCMPLFATITAFGFTGQVRYHHPAMPFLVIAAGWTLAALARMRRARLARSNVAIMPSFA